MSDRSDWKQTDSGRAIVARVIERARAASVYDPPAVIPLLDWSVVETTATGWGRRVTDAGEDQIERGIRRLGADRPDLFREVPTLAPREAHEHLTRLVAEGRTADAAALRAKHGAAIEAAGAQVARERRDAAIAERRREREETRRFEERRRLEHAIAEGKRTLDRFARTGELHPWNGMGQPPDPPSPADVQALRDRIARDEERVRALAAS